MSFYDNLIFDCDGVILNSNLVKSNAFYEVALPYGKDAADRLLSYNRRHGGISRIKKFSYFINDILNIRNQDTLLRELLDQYAANIEKGLLECEVAEGLNELKAATKGSRWFIVSGGAESELQDLFNKRDIDKYFDGGIFGNPRNKDDILNHMAQSGLLTGKSLFLGDSEYDHKVAKIYNLDFVFIYEWTEFRDWMKYCREEGLRSVEAVKEVLPLLSS